MRINNPHRLRRLTLFFCLLLSCALWAGDSAATATATKLSAPGSASDGLFPERYSDPRGGLLSRITEAPSFLRAASPLRALLPFYTSLLTDDFNDNLRDASKWNLVTPGGAVPALEQNQRLEIKPLVNGAGSNYNGYTSTVGYDLTGARASVEVVQATGGTGGAETVLKITDSSSSANAGRFVVANGILFCQYKQAGSGYTTLAAPGYSPTQHRRWQLRHDAAADTLYWETSPDGASWTTLASVTDPFPVTSVLVTLTSGTWYEQAWPGEAIFDNFLMEPNQTNNPPAVALTTPAANTSFTAPATISIAANASDPDAGGSVTKVEFFAETMKLGEDTTAPFTFTWSNVAAGSYSLTAKATDNGGAQTTSAAVGITVALSPTTNPLADDFNDNAMDAAKWVLRTLGSGVTAAEQNQRLEITPVANAVGSNYNGYRTAAAYDLTGARASVEVVQATGGTGGAETGFNFNDSAGNSARFVVANGALFCQYKVAGQSANTTVSAPGYSPLQHRRWRLRHDQAADTLNWETSPDGASWATLGSVARPFPLTALQVTLTAGTWYEQASPGMAIFDNFLLEPNPANTPPSVALTAPAAGATFTAPASITLSAAATDADGGVAKVEFYSGTTLLGTVTSAPYNFTWNNVGAGSYGLTAKATDNSGAQTTTAAVGVTVSLPTVTITATDASASEQGPDAGTFTITRAGASGLTNSPLTVYFTAGGTATGGGTDYASIGTSVTIPVGATSQTVTITPVDDAVVENGGETVVLTLTANAAYTVGTPSSATVNIADNDTYPPTASITSPAGGTVFTVPASIEISAAASDSDGTVAKVEFYQGATKLGEDTTAPYSFTWNPAAGSYSLTARATDNAGATGTSAPVSVVVNTPPAVSVTGPADNTAVYAGTNVQLTASASDPDQGDAVAKVEFFQGTTKLGEDATAPYAFSWQNVPEGSYTLTAVATDGRGAQTTSAVVHLAAADFTAARLDPSNRTGSGGVDLYSRNFNWSLPVVALPGRAGLDLGLSLSYNSLVWTKSGGGVLFDGDGGWPAPGFRLGFPVVQGQFYDTQAQKTAYLLITPSGARVSLRQTAVPTVYEAGDSSYLQLTEETDGSLTLVMLGGARMTYRVHGAVYQCEKITDPNGNFITIAYDGYGRLDAVTDTLGRLVDFEYYPDGYLKEIKQTWHREVEGAAPVTETHYWARFEYVDVTLGINFPGLMPVGAQNGQAFHALRKVKLADDSSFVFDYTSWGQVSQVKAYAPDNRLLNYLKLNLPVDASQSQSDCPRPTELRSWAAYANGDADGAPAQAEELLTSYEVTDGATWTTPEDNQPQTGRLGRTTSPDGTVYKEYAPSAGWNRGLVRLNEIWSGGVKKKWTSTAWTQDDEALQYTQNPRVRETNVYDSNEDGSLHSRRRTEIVYTTFGLPQEVKEYDSNATTVLRRTVMTYVAASVNGVGAYATRRIIGLPSKREVYGLDDTSEKLYSKVTYEYDCGGQFLSAPEGSPASVAQHDDANFGTAFNTRGNPCRTRRWDADDRENLTKSVAAESGYNTLGSPVFNRDALGHQTSVTYADSDGGGRFAYPTTVTDPSGFTASAWYNYDLGVVMKTVTPTPQGTNGQPTVTRYYDAAGRPLKAAAGPSGTYTRWEYGASGLYVKVLTKVDTDKPETFVMSVTDGDGAAVGMLREHPGDGTGYAASRSEYDPVNRVVKRYNPVEVMVNAGDLSNARLWVPAGPDVTRLGRAGWPYSATEYDWKGRVRREVNPDGSDRLTDYNGCGCAGGEVVTTRGELVPTNAPSPAPAQGRRAQRVYHDILGRPQKTELLDWVGSVYSSTTTKYDALDRPVRVREYAGPAPVVEPEGEGGSYQTTAMSYDGHGRLHTRHLPIYDANTLVTYEYNNDDTGHSVTDPRGVKTTFTYNSRGMVTRVAYDPQLSGVPNTPDVTFDYDAAGNRIAMTDEAGSTSYQYDALSRLSSETRQFGGITQRTYTLTYAYTLAGQLKSMTDPFGVTTSYDRDTVGRVTGVTGSGYPAIPQLANGVQFASGIQYRAWGAVSSTNYGDGRGMSADFDSRLRVTGFHLTGSLLMDKSYEYEDGALRFADDQLDHAFDRSYTYDHAGRLAAAHTGEQARGGTADDGPYQQTYAYDPFGHSAGQTNLLWKQVVGGGTVQYTNDRRQGWNYDAAGGLTFDQLRHYVNDAAGRMKSFGPGLQSYAYDGDGQLARVTRQLEGTTVVYNLRSTALGGAVVSQLKPQPNALDVRQDIIPLGDGAEARRDVGVTGEQVTWSHDDPASTTVQEGGFSSFGGPNGTFNNPVVQLDPVGASVGWADPAQFEEPPPPPDETSPEGRVYNNPLRPGTTCFNNYVRVECGQLMDDISSRAGGMRLRIDRLETGTSFRRLNDLRNTPVGEGVEVADGQVVSTWTSVERKDWYSRSFEGYIWGLGVAAAVQPQKPKITMELVKKALGECISELVPQYALVSFSPTTDPGTNPDDSHNGLITIKDVETGNVQSIHNDITPPADVRASMLSANDHPRGISSSSNPWWTYALPPRDYTDGNTLRPGERRYPDLYLAPGMRMVRVQFHEFGAVLWGALLFRDHMAPWAPIHPDTNKLDPGHGDSGPAMEDCIGRRVYAALGLKPGP